MKLSEFKKMFTHYAIWVDRVDGHLYAQFPYANTQDATQATTDAYNMFDALLAVVEAAQKLLNAEGYCTDGNEDWDRLREKLEPFRESETHD